MGDQSIRLASDFEHARPRRRLLPLDRAVHRVLDLVVGVPLTIVALPLIGVGALAVRLTSRGPVIFRQTRVGLDERPFTVFKLRTMRLGVHDDDAVALQRAELTDPDYVPPTSDGAYKPENDRRVTRVGKFLRRTSIDELPQLFNVLRGDMSIVGPRPLVPWEVELIEPRLRRRHVVRPGITGLYQTSGRAKLSAHRMLELDLEYVERRSVRFDLAILARSVPALLSDTFIAAHGAR